MSSNEREVTCPSGLSGVVRGLRGTDIRAMSDRSAVKSGAAFEAMLASCWVRTTSDGPCYNFPEGKVDWSKVLVGDRMYVLLQIRLATYPGEAYPFKIKCPDCLDPIDWEVDLNLLHVKQLTPSAAATYKTGNEFPFKLDTGLQGSFRLMTGDDERRTRKRALGNGGSVDVINVLKERIVSLDGKTDQWSIEKTLLDMGAAEHRDMIAAFDEHDCGVETTIEVRCACGTETEVQLPFDQGFLIAKPKKKQTSATAQ